MHAGLAALLRPEDHEEARRRSGSGAVPFREVVPYADAVRLTRRPVRRAAGLADPEVATVYEAPGWCIVRVLWTRGRGRYVYPVEVEYTDAELGITTDTRIRKEANGSTLMLALSRLAFAARRLGRLAIARQRARRAAARLLYGRGIQEAGTPQRAARQRELAAALAELGLEADEVWWLSLDDEAADRLARYFDTRADEEGFPRRGEVDGGVD
jgi:hypothetical protein